MLDAPTSVLWHLDVPMQGYEGTAGTWSPALDPLLSGATLPPSANNDVIAIRTIRAGWPQFRTQASTAATADIVVNKTAGQKVQGLTFVINDCSHESIFVATVADNGTTATLTRGTGGATPTNLTADLGWDFQKGALVSPLDTVIYYIAPSATPAVQNGDAGPALWRIVSSDNNGNPQPEEVIPGVERMEIQYGVDTDADTVVDQYLDAHAVEVAHNWNNVISARIAILVRSPQANAAEVDVKSYTLLNATVGPFNDRYERSVFTTTVTLRNRTS
jgi:type IV pilus assembly protein PilW